MGEIPANHQNVRANDDHKHKNSEDIGEDTEMKEIYDSTPSVE